MTSLSMTSQSHKASECSFLLEFVITTPVPSFLLQSYKQVNKAGTRHFWSPVETGLSSFMTTVK